MTWYYGKSLSDATQYGFYTVGTECTDPVEVSDADYATLMAGCTCNKHIEPDAVGYPVLINGGYVESCPAQPSLTELSYVVGATSNIQDQIDAIIEGNVVAWINVTVTGVVTKNVPVSVAVGGMTFGGLTGSDGTITVPLSTVGRYTAKLELDSDFFSTSPSSVTGVIEVGETNSIALTSNARVKVYTTNSTAHFPMKAKYKILCFGGGGGRSSRYAGGGGGHMGELITDLDSQLDYQVTIGAIGIVSSTHGTPGGSGGATSFGTLVSASGGSGGLDYVGGSGGTGGGGAEAYSQCIGGNGSYGGGGGGYVGGTGGIYGGNGGYNFYDGTTHTADQLKGEDGTDTRGMDLDFTGAGIGGAGEEYLNYTRSHKGGSGGYGGNGGPSTFAGFGGGGGYGGNGGSGNAGSSSGGGGGGGGYGGPGGACLYNSTSTTAGGGGGGGGYGSSNYGRGGDRTNAPLSGCVVIKCVGEADE